MGFFSDGFKFLGETAGGFVGGVIGVGGRVLAEVPALICTLAGDKEAAKEIRNGGVEFLEQAIDVGLAIGGSLGEVAGETTELTVFVAGQAGEVLGSVAGGIAGVGVMATGAVIAGAQELVGEKEAAQKTLAVAENIAEGAVEVGGYIGDKVAKAALIKVVVAKTAIAAVGAVLSDSVADSVDVDADGFDSPDSMPDLVSSTDAPQTMVAAPEPHFGWAYPETADADELIPDNNGNGYISQNDYVNGRNPYEPA